jgi:hypothetical protein
MDRLLAELLRRTSKHLLPYLRHNFNANIFKNSSEIYEMKMDRLLAVTLRITGMPPHLPYS